MLSLQTCWDQKTDIYKTFYTKRRFTLSYFINFQKIHENAFISYIDFKMHRDLVDR